MNTESPPEAGNLANRHGETIKQAVAQEFNLQPKDLMLLESYESEAKPGTYSFLLAHSTGQYGVNAGVNADGDLQDIRCSRL